MQTGHVIVLVDWVASDQVDQGIRRFYIKLGRHLLDKSFILNSDSILIYWYSFTNNKLYFQV
jgi:hypothetical protein